MLYLVLGVFTRPGPEAAVSPSLREAQRRGNLCPRHCEERSDVAISERIHRTRSVPVYVKEYVMKPQPAVYTLTNKPDSTLYTGVTSDLPKRIWQHKNRVMKGFSTRYNLTWLIHFVIQSGDISLRRFVTDGDCRVAALLAMTGPGRVPPDKSANTVSAVRQGEKQISVCSTISRASSTSIPRYLMVLSSLV